MLNIGSGELLIIFLVALVFLGPTRLPEVARQMGQAMGSLRSLASGFQAELAAASKPDEPDMTLTGPISQDDAVAQTQQPTATDPNDIGLAARTVSYDDEDAQVATGGPRDLRDEEE